MDSLHFAEQAQNLNRWYSASAGRYISKDPLESQDQLEHLWYPRVSSTRSSLFSYVDSNPLAFIDPLGLLKFEGCSVEKQTQISQAFENYCKKLENKDFNDCMCETPVLAEKLKRTCVANDRKVSCREEEARMCTGNCAWSIPFGKKIRLCQIAWEANCGPLGCTLLHEVTHQLGHGGEELPEKVERCLQCQ